MNLDLNGDKQGFFTYLAFTVEAQAFLQRFSLIAIRDWHTVFFLYSLIDPLPLFSRQESDWERYLSN